MRGGFLSFIVAIEAAAPVIHACRAPDSIGHGQPQRLQVNSDAVSERPFTRTELDRIVRPVIESCHEPVLQVFREANTGPEEVDRLVFVGGATRMPMVRAFFEELIGHKCEVGVDPMGCIAQGAAIHAGKAAGDVDAVLPRDEVR